jgi:hypothetical protein
MRYRLYTTVDITNTGQYRNDPAKDALRWKEQNFQTVLQTIGIRANIVSYTAPTMMVTNGIMVGFEVNKNINVWSMEFETERDFLFDKAHDPIGLLKDDFELVPYISGLDECMEQSYDVFVTYGPTRNIVFYKN